MMATPMRKLSAEKYSNRELLADVAFSDVSAGTSPAGQVAAGVRLLIRLPVQHR